MSLKILFGIPPKSHLILALDEVSGFNEIGYICNTFTYGKNDEKLNYLMKFISVLVNAFNLVIALYKFHPHILYLNSRFEPIGSVRDFISIYIIKLLYFKKIKIVIKSHGSDLSILSSKSFFYNRLVLPFLINNVNAWFFLSNEEKTIIQSHSSKLSQQVYVTSNIIDPSRSIASYDFKIKYNLDPSKFNFLFVGRIVEEKGVYNLVNAISRFPYKINCVFNFVGSGRDLNNLIEIVNDLKINEYVKFHGFVAESCCDHFFANTDALVFPTFDSEGFPMALFKAIAAGLPVITTNIRAAKDYLVSPTNVLWVDGKSADTIVDAITTLYNNHQIRVVMSQNNIKLGAKFSRLNVCRQMSEVISLI